MIGFKVSGSFKNTKRYLTKLQWAVRRGVFDKYGAKGVAALASATPVDTGFTASSWYYKIESGKDNVKLLFCNSNIQNGVPIAVILQTGHGTRNGGWVEGRDYINPAIQPIFDEIVSNAWGEVTRL